jgi:hypothetical protein
MDVISKLYNLNALHGNAIVTQQPQAAQADFVPSVEQIPWQFRNLVKSHRLVTFACLHSDTVFHCALHKLPLALQCIRNNRYHLRVLPHIQTLNRELRCIGKARTYLLVIRPTKAVPHPPTPPNRPGQISLKLRQQLKNPKRRISLGFFLFQEASGLDQIAEQARSD